MKLLDYLLKIVVLGSVQVAFSQYSVDGKVQDNLAHEVEFANVVLFAQPDSTFVQATISDAKGAFLFTNIERGKYWLMISFLGYERKSKNIEITKNTTIPIISLAPQTSTLNEVTLKVHQPTIVNKKDRLIFTVENTSLSSGSSWDILQHAPGVINVQGELKVKNATATIYINNHKVWLSNEELTQLLESYSGENIKSIEVITNPSASYDANSGPILNIITKKTIYPGYKGSVEGSYTQAIYPKYRLGTSHYYKGKKINAFFNYSANLKKEDKRDNSYIHYINNDQAIFSTWKTDFERITKTTSHNANTIIDYDINEKNKVSLHASALWIPKQDYTNRGQTRIFNAPHQMDSLFITHSQLHSDKENLNLDASYQLKTSKSSQLSSTFHYTYFDKTARQFLTTDYFTPDFIRYNQNNFGTNAYQKVNIYVGQIDFTANYKKYAIETGLKFSDIISESKLTYTDIQTNAQVFFNEGLSDKFNYDEQVYAGYISIDRDWEKFSSKIGLRAEQTYRVGIAELLQAENKRNYLEWFPSVYASYKITKNHSLAFTYNRKIKRPDYENLNPFRYFISEHSFQSGTPNLRASISNNFNLNYTFKNAYSFDFYYRDNGKEIVPMVFQDNEHLYLRSIYTNIEESNSYGLDFFHGKSINSWWYGQAVLSVYHEEQSFVAEESGNVVVDNKIDGFYASLYNKLTFSKDRTFSGNVHFVYVSSLLQGSYKIDEIITLSLGLKKSFMKGRAEASLNLADVLNQTATPLTSNYLNQNNGFFAQPENRYIQLGFVYNFGNFGLKDNNQKIETNERDRLK